MAKPVRKIVLPVAGLGTRFLPATKAIPKEMLPVVDKPVIQYAVEEAVAAGIDQIIFVTGRGKAALEDHFDHAFELEAILQGRGKTATLEQLVDGMFKPGNVMYTRQQQPMGLGHAIWCARRMIGDEPFAVSLPDMLTHGPRSCLQDLVSVYEEKGGNVVALKETNPEETEKYGIAKLGAENGDVVEVAGLVEKPKPADAPSNLYLLGRYILQPDIFDLLEKQERGAGNEIQLTDSMAKLIGRQPFHGHVFRGSVFDCGDKVGFLHANVALGFEREDIRPRLEPLLRALTNES